MLEKGMSGNGELSRTLKQFNLHINLLHRHLKRKSDMIGWSKNDIQYTNCPKFPNCPT